MTPGFDPHEIAERIVREASADARRLVTSGRWWAIGPDARAALILGRAWPYMLTRCDCMSVTDLRALMLAVDERACRAAGVQP